MKIADQLTRLLSQGISGNQARLVDALEQQGVSTTQSSVSRALKKINAVKGLDEKGQTVYTLPASGRAKPLGKQERALFSNLVSKVLDNGHMIVVHTRPGTAPTVAKVLDDHGFDEVIGTVAGDDTILIIPRDVKKTRQLSGRISQFLTRVGLF